MYQNSILQKVCGIACSLILIIASSVGLNARPQEEDIRINLELKDATLQKVMDEIKGQSPYLFFTSQVDLTRTVSVSVRNETIGNVCRQVFSPLGIDYKINGHYIYLSNKPTVKPRTLSGTVTV